MLEKYGTLRGTLRRWQGAHKAVYYQLPEKQVLFLLAPRIYSGFSLIYVTSCDLTDVTLVCEDSSHFQPHQTIISSVNLLTGSFVILEEKKKDKNQN